MFQANPGRGSQSDDFLTYAFILHGFDSSVMTFGGNGHATGHIVSIPTDVYAEVDSNTFTGRYLQMTVRALLLARASVTNIRLRIIG